MPYPLIITPLIAGLVAQAIKLLIEFSKGDLEFKTMFNRCGGMPSSHSAFVVSLALAIGLTEGFGSTSFGIAFLLALIVIRDAAGFRRHIERYFKSVNILIAKLPVSERKKLPYLKKRFGHSPLEILIGSLIGIAVVLLAKQLSYLP